ncbi:hypothetical protein ELG88_17970 [Rhizobium leguminosarum]|uniref:hypothetical protein n=1 Tax=Rhizobium leguminosarum TaxID=384 RepID=UPI00102FD67F|nr:hypothetical protein [Rhizobium leguminosarum]TBF36974.1 hypothetical protein ELG88_17970 [Rhizobium leguminosarum]
MTKKIEVVQYQLGNHAVLKRAVDGGPIRFPVTGRKRNTTHIYTSTKVANHIMPAESDAELEVANLLDVSTSVITYMAQPHTLEFARINDKGWWRYTPDFEVIVPRWFVRELTKGTPFAVAALKLPQARAAADDLVHLVLEVKGASKYRSLGEADRTEEQKAKRQAKKEDYAAKLVEAESIYTEFGFHFYLVEDKRDLQCINLAHLSSILVDAEAIISQELKGRAVAHLQSCNGMSTYGQVIELLGGSPYGREAANFLHTQGLIWIDLSEDPALDADVAMPPMLGNRRSLISLSFCEEVA